MADALRCGQVMAVTMKMLADDEEHQDVVARHGDDVRVPAALAGQPWPSAATRQQAARQHGDAKLREILPDVKEMSRHRETARILPPKKPLTG